MIVSINFVSVVPASFVKDIESPIFNSSLNLVPKPVNTLLATVIEPLNFIIEKIGWFVDRTYGTQGTLEDFFA